MGFRLADTVMVGGRQAVVTSISPNEITAIAPAAAAGVTGSVDVEVDDLPIFYAAAVISGGVSYDSGTGDALTLLTAPSNTVPIGVPMPFYGDGAGRDHEPGGRGDRDLHGDQRNGDAWLRIAGCAVTATGDGRATMNVTATRRRLVHCHGFADQWFAAYRRSSRGERRRCLSSLTPHAILGRGGHGDLDDCRRWC